MGMSPTFEAPEASAALSHNDTLVITTARRVSKLLMPVRSPRVA